jgi:hypothetical protein
MSPLKEITVIIHTEDKTKLSKLLDSLKKSKIKNNVFDIYINAKGYTPWTDKVIFDKIVNLPKKYYSANSTEFNSVLSINELIYRVKTNSILIIDEDNTCFDFKEWDTLNNTYLLAKTSDLLYCNQDTKYQSIKWFIADLISQKTKHPFLPDTSPDSERYDKKRSHPLFYERIIYIDGGLGDHVMAYPLLEKIGQDCYVSCIYPSVLGHIDVKGFVDWQDDLFGGHKRFVYSYGLVNDESHLIDALFKMYNVPREKTDVMKYNGPKVKFNNTSGKPIVVVSTTAARVNGNESNKNWKDIRWFKLIYHLRNLGYHVIQAGSHKDNQLPLHICPYDYHCPAGVDEKFLDKSIAELAGLIDEASLWISVDTFFHPFASSIKPETGICLIPFYNDYVKHPKVTYIEKDCGKNYYNRRWWLDYQQPERKESLGLIQVEDILKAINDKN